MHKILKLLVASLLILSLSSCLDPNKPQGNIPPSIWRSIADEVNSKPARTYVANKVRFLNNNQIIKPNGVPTWAWVNQNTINIDTDCTRWPCWQLVKDRGWWLWHEIAHVMPSVWPNDEQKAQCVAEAIMHREVIGFTYYYPYWNCPPTHVAGIIHWLYHSVGVRV